MFGAKPRHAKELRNHGIAHLPTTMHSMSEGGAPRKYFSINTLLKLSLAGRASPSFAVDRVHRKCFQAIRPEIWNMTCTCSAVEKFMLTRAYKRPFSETGIAALPIRSRSTAWVDPIPAARYSRQSPGTPTARALPTCRCLLPTITS